MLGNMLPTSDNPVRLAKEIAMLDVIPSGRIISGFVRGIGIESWANNTNQYTTGSGSRSATT